MPKKPTDDPFAKKNAVEPKAEQTALFDYTDGQYLEELRMDWIRPWEQNPRKNFDASGLLELAESIAHDGIQQPIVVRLVGSKPSALGSDIPDFQIVMGERRFLASQMLSKPTIRAIVRVDLSDKDALRLAIIENIKRRDLNAIEESDSYRALLDAGFKQEEIAAQVGVAQGTISNALRLRKLSDAIRQMLVEGKLSASHARNLLRFEGFPAIQEHLAEWIIETGASSKSLEKGIPNLMYLIRDGLVMDLNGYNTNARREFDVAICQSCPLSAYRTGEGYGQYCLRPDHFRQLNIEAQAEREANRAAAIAAFQAVNTQSTEERQANVSEETPEVPDLHDVQHLPSGSYAVVNVCPPGCTDQCACRMDALQWGKPVVVCINPQRYRKLEKAAFKAKNQKRREGLQEGKKAAEMLACSMDDAGALALLVVDDFHALTGTVATAIRDTVPQTPLAALLEKQRYNRTRLEVLKALAELPPAMIVTLGAKAKLLTELKSAAETEYTSPLFTEWYFARNNSTPEQVEEEEEKEAIFDAIADEIAAEINSGFSVPTLEGMLAQTEQILCASCGVNASLPREKYCRDCHPALTSEAPEATIDLALLFETGQRVWLKDDFEKTRRSAVVVLHSNGFVQVRLGGKDRTQTVHEANIVPMQPFEITMIERGETLDDLAGEGMVTLR